MKYGGSTTQQNKARFTFQRCQTLGGKTGLAKLAQPERCQRVRPLGNAVALLFLT